MGTAYFVAGAATVIAGIAAKKLLTPDEETPLKDESLPTLSTRGSYIPLLIGTRRISPFIAWTGNRQKKEEPPAGGKGINTGGSDAQLVYYGDGIHVLAVAPEALDSMALHAIKINGKNAKFNNGNPLYSESTASGTAYETKDGDTFQIFWGNQDPVVTDGLINGLGIDTKWKKLVIVFWNQKRLGGFPTWPNVQYDLEVRPQVTAIDTSGWAAASWMQNGPGPNGTTHNILGINNSSKIGDPVDPPYVKVWNSGDSATVYYKPGGYCEIRNQPDILVNKIYAIDSSSYDDLEVYQQIKEDDWFLAVNADFEEEVQKWIEDGSPGDVDLNVNTGQPYPSGFSSSDGQLVTIINNEPLTLQGARTGSNTVIPTGAIHFRYFIYGIGDVPGTCTWVQFGLFKKGAGEEGPVMQIVRDPSTNEFTVQTSGDDGWVGNKYYLYDVVFEDAGNNWFRVEFKHNIQDADVPFGPAEEYQVFTKCYNTTQFGATDAKIRIFNYEDEDNDTIWMLRKNAGVSRQGITTINLAEPLNNAVPEEGQIEGYSEDSDEGADGPNPAYSLAQLLFEPFPYGRGLDTTLWDETTLETFATTAENEGLRLHVLATEGKTVEEAVQSLLLDSHAYIAWDPNKGKYIFGTVRKEETFPTLPKEALAREYAEQENILDPDIPSIVVYDFTDRDLGYRKNTQPVYNDANSYLHGGRKSEKVSLETPTDLFAARVIAARRRDETTIPANKYKITAKGEARTLVPGSVLKIEGFPADGEEEVLRIGSIQIDPDSPEITIDAITDIVTVAGEETLGPLNGPDDGGFGPGPPTSERDLYSEIWELPPFLSNGQVSVSLLRIAANGVSTTADILASTDGAQYSYIGINKAAIGATLVSDIPTSTGFVITDDPPVVKPVGARPLADVPSLTNTEWQRGRTLVYIGGELFYLKKVTPTGAGGYKLDGLIRARLGTRKISHSLGDIVYIFKESDIKIHSDLSFSVGNLIYLKAQPPGLSLTEVLATERTIAGTGIRPLSVHGLRTSNLSNHYRTGEDITVSWVFFDPDAFTSRYGSGFQRAGELKEEVSEPQGYFRVTYLSGAVTLRKVETRKNTLTYTNADLVADTGGPEPDPLTIEVEMIQNGYRSAKTTLSVVKL